MSETEEYQFEKFIDDAIEEIDAAMFSGDSFEDSREAIEKFNYYLQRWQRGLLEKARLVGFRELEEVENE